MYEVVRVQYFDGNFKAFWCQAVEDGTDSFQCTNFVVSLATLLLSLLSVSPLHQRKWFGTVVQEHFT